MMSMSGKVQIGRENFQTNFPLHSGFPPGGSGRGPDLLLRVTYYLINLLTYAFFGILIYFVSWGYWCGSHGSILALLFLYCNVTFWKIVVCKSFMFDKELLVLPEYTWQINLPPKVLSAYSSVSLCSDPKLQLFVSWPLYAIIHPLTCLTGRQIWVL